MEELANYVWFYLTHTKNVMNLINLPCQIIEVLDNRGPDNQGSTVMCFLNTTGSFFVVCSIPYVGYDMTFIITPHYTSYYQVSYFFFFSNATTYQALNHQLSWSKELFLLHRFRFVSWCWLTLYLPASCFLSRFIVGHQQAAENPELQTSFIFILHACM